MGKSDVYKPELWGHDHENFYFTFFQTTPVGMGCGWVEWGHGDRTAAHGREAMNVIRTRDHDKLGRAINECVCLLLLLCVVVVIGGARACPVPGDEYTDLVHISFGRRLFVCFFLYSVWPAPPSVKRLGGWGSVGL